MRVLYDHQAFIIQKFGGISKSFCELISHFTNDVDFRVSISESNNIHLLNSGLIPNLCSPCINKENFITGKKIKGKDHLYYFINKLIPNFPSVENVNLKSSISLLKKGDFDIFHPTYFDDYFLKYLKGKPFVLTIHDMMPELFPQYFKYNNMQIVLKKKLSFKAAAIVAVSQQTKNDIIKILGVPEEKISVIYHGAPVREDIRETSLFDFPYFLYVGIRNYYKNFRLLLHDFSLFIQTKPFIKMVCTGSPFSREEQLLIIDLKLQDSVVYIQATDTQLKILYANAIAFVYPSLYEGFGMPILEAFAYGCPVLLNKKSCFPEIADGAAIYFKSDENSSNICKAFEYITSCSSQQRSSIINAGYKRLSMFSWEKSSQQLADLYRTIL